MAKDKKKSFYSIKEYNSGLTNGRSITVSRTITYNGENADFSQFLSTPPKELEKQLKASMAEEKKVYDGLNYRRRGAVQGVLGESNVRIFNLVVVIIGPRFPPLKFLRAGEVL